MLDSPRIAVLIAVGPLDRYGYQHIYMPVLDNLSAFAACIYLCSSTRNRNGVDKFLNLFPNTIYISNENTWLPVNNQGREVFSLYPLAENTNRMVEIARADGMDCVALFSINQYLPEENRKCFLEECLAMISNNEPFRWMYKRIQLGGRLFEIDRRVPFVINLHFPQRIMVEADAVRLPESGEYYRNTLGDFRDKKSISTVDVPRELTQQDLEELRCFIRNYDETNPGVDPTFIWERDKWREVTKYSAKRFSSDPLSPTGRIIARNSRPDFVSQYLLKMHPDNKPWYVRQGQRLKAWLGYKSVLRRLLRSKLTRGSE
ncbi:MAG: hypothetical protein JW963_03575 [Anaerolineales bacterium]|nr:hypothetical protein [Anaerolineales bacterium]